MYYFKNKVVVVEDAYIYTTYNEIFDNEIFDSEYLEIDHSNQYFPISVNSNSMKRVEISTNAVVYVDKRNLNVKNKCMYYLPFSAVLSVKIDEKRYRKNVSISIIIEYISNENI